MPETQRCGFNPWVGKIPWRRKWQHTPVFLLKNPMDRAPWWAKGQRVRHDWVTKHTSTHEHSCTFLHQNSKVSPEIILRKWMVRTQRILMFNPTRQTKWFSSFVLATYTEHQQVVPCDPHPRQHFCQLFSKM